MGSVSKASWIAAASVAAVEALKDQAGLCRWNYAIKTIHQHAKSSMSSFSQANYKRMATSSSLTSVDRLRRGREAEKAKQSEESLRKIMYLSCWGPN